MQRCSFNAYEGKQPYIFVSYAHKDSDRVFPVLEELDRRGYRVWYDDGIAPGSEWPENIAQHLDGCAVTLAFISPASIASANCRREVTFALSKRKPFLGIVLEETAMSLGMEMQLSAQQCIMKYTYQTEEAFLEKVCSCPDLKPCLGKPKAAPVPEEAPAPAPQPKPVQPKAPTKPLDKKTLGIIAGAAAAVLLIVLLVSIFAGGGEKSDDNTLGENPGTSENRPQGTKPEQTGGTDTQPQDTEPQDTQPGETEYTEPGETDPSDYTGEWALYYNNQVITAKDVQYINQQKELCELRMTDCVIQKGAFDGLQLPKSLELVSIRNCKDVTNLRSLGDLEGLYRLELVNSGITDDMLPDQFHGKLDAVEIQENPGITDLSPFAPCTQITFFNFSDTAVTSVQPLAGMENLYEVYGSRSQVKDLTALMNLTELRTLHMAGCGIEAISGDCYSLYLEDLDLSENELVNIDAFQYCTILSRVDLAYNRLEGVSAVMQKNAESLNVLKLAGNTYMSTSYLGFLKACTNLSELSLDGMFLYDLEIIKDLNLRVLSANCCTLYDISALRNHTSLNILSLAGNYIEDISPLSGLEYCDKLDLSFNTGLKDVSALPQKWYNYLNLTNENLDWSTITGVSGEMILLAADLNMGESSLFQERPFARYAIVACPLDYVVQVETALGKENVVFAQDETAYCALLEELGMDYRYMLATEE